MDSFSSMSFVAGSRLPGSRSDWGLGFRVRVSFVAVNLLGVPSVKPSELRFHFIFDVLAQLVLHYWVH